MADFIAPISVVAGNIILYGAAGGVVGFVLGFVGSSPFPTYSKPLHRAVKIAAGIGTVAGIAYGYHEGILSWDRISSPKTSFNQVSAAPAASLTNAAKYNAIKSNNYVIPADFFKKPAA